VKDSIDWSYNIFIVILAWITLSIISNAIIYNIKNDCYEKCLPGSDDNSITEYQEKEAVYLLLIPFSELFNEHKGCICYNKEYYNITIEGE